MATARACVTLTSAWVNPDGSQLLLLNGGRYHVKIAADSTQSTTRYYSIAGQRPAMRNNDGSINYLLGDHLGSVSTIVNANGEIVSQSRYLPFGELLWEDGDSPTDYSYTGQRSLSDIGLMDYNARFYDPMLGRFTSPDSIIPDPGSVIGYNLFAYVNNNPIRYTDPTGHFCYDANTNTFSEGECYDQLQEQLLNYFDEELENDEMSDLDITTNLIEMALQYEEEDGNLINPVAGLRATAEVVRAYTPPGFAWSFSQSQFYYNADGSKGSLLNDSGFGDLKDTVSANQINHFIGIAYIAAFLRYDSIINRNPNPIKPFVMGYEWKNSLMLKQSWKQTFIDQDLGNIAADLGTSLVNISTNKENSHNNESIIVQQNAAIQNAVNSIVNYDYIKRYAINSYVDLH